MVKLALANGASPGGYEGTWTVTQAPPDAVVALNAGRFTGGATWGWVVHEGVEYRAPQPGPLAAAVVIDTAGIVSFSLPAPSRAFGPKVVSSWQKLSSPIPSW
jgi:hypothetical protein